MSPDRRKHRGAHPEDARLFDDARLPSLRAATDEMSWLLSRGYQPKSALKLVGDRHGLRERQRLAVGRAACSDESRERRRTRCLSAQEIERADLIVDGFNLLITVEAALSGGLLILCRDGCVRDLSSVHGSYRSVNETANAIEVIGNSLVSHQPGSVTWLLDRPISNSGRLAQRIRETAAARNWQWTGDLPFNPDAEMIRADGIVISSDGPLLDRVRRWANLAAKLIEKSLADILLVD